MSVSKCINTIGGDGFGGPPNGAEGAEQYDQSLIGKNINKKELKS